MKSSPLQGMTPAEFYELVKNQCDAIYVEVRDMAKEVAANSKSIEIFEVRNHIDNVEEHRTELSRIKMRASRAWREAKDEYDDGMRDAIVGKTSGVTSLHRATHFEERKAEAETANISTYKDSVKLFHCIEELDFMLSFVRDKIFWLRGIREDIINREKGLFYANNDDYAT